MNQPHSGGFDIKTQLLMLKSSSDSSSIWTMVYSFIVIAVVEQCSHFFPILIEFCRTKMRKQFSFNLPKLI